MAGTVAHAVTGADVVRLREYGAPVERRLPAAHVEALRATGLVSAEYLPDGRFRVRAADKVGMARVGSGSLGGGTLMVIVEPKVSVARLVYLLGYSRRVAWREEVLDVPQDDDLLPAVARVLATLGEQALSRGVLQGYWVVEEPVSMVRGRLLVAAQARRRAGLALPVECRFDEWTVDTAENRLLLAGATVARALPGVPDDVRRRLRRIEAHLDGVSRLPFGSPVPVWHPSRLNLRYQPALRMAEVVLRHASSAALPAGALQFHGFVVSMAEVFESFVTEALRVALSRYGGSVATQKTWWLDRRGDLKIRPDLTWMHGGRVVAVVDAKYKAADRVLNADAYQVLTYCARLGLPVGHLVYAASEEPERFYDIPGAGVRIVQHALDMAVPTTAALHGGLDRVAAAVTGGRLPGR